MNTSREDKISPSSIALGIVESNKLVAIAGMLLVDQGTRVEYCGLEPEITLVKPLRWLANNYSIVAICGTFFDGPYLCAAFDHNKSSLKIRTNH